MMNLKAPALLGTLLSFLVSAPAFGALPAAAPAAEPLRVPAVLSPAVAGSAVIELKCPQGTAADGARVSGDEVTVTCVRLSDIPALRQKGELTKGACPPGFLLNGLLPLPEREKEEGQSFTDLRLLCLEASGVGKLSEEGEMTAERSGKGELRCPEASVLNGFRYVKEAGGLVAPQGLCRPTELK